jgi:hypothetical protein
MLFVICAELFFSLYSIRFHIAAQVYHRIKYYLCFLSSFYFKCSPVSATHILVFLYFRVCVSFLQEYDAITLISEVKVSSYIAVFVRTGCFSLKVTVLILRVYRDLEAVDSAYFIRAKYRCLQFIFTLLNYNLVVCKYQFSLTMFLGCISSSRRIRRVGSGCLRPPITKILAVFTDT